MILDRDAQRLSKEENPLQKSLSLLKLLLVKSIYQFVKNAHWWFTNDGPFPKHQF